MATSRPRVAVIHGPNLNLLGTREPEVYGTLTLAELDASLIALGDELSVDVECQQRNSEGAIIDLLHAARGRVGGVIINPGGYTHTSVAIHDAIKAIAVPTVEVHLSNTYQREAFRQRSLTAAACVGAIIGLGAASYHLALRHLAALLRAPQA
ncbi:MAG: type II 3-dehydroquinate dehydratase [Myxococcales bacterium]|nr:type II 3-dehydroquinate dehydratase [Myxococcales bacterium]MCB9567449.1 type II 3-dehydroquinate dehydratase [Myxococcales bacterium]MCB9700677.1 type II 3-dehydroquinate dehydratase [Myxococcales bacterium]